MQKKMFFSLTISLLFANCNSPVKPVIHEEISSREEKNLRIVSFQTVNDTTIKYGTYPNLPEVLNVGLNDSSKIQLPVYWDLSINPSIPGTYYAKSHVAISGQNIQDDSLNVAITVENTDSVRTLDKKAGSYLGGGYDSSQFLVGAAINTDSMEIFEKPINQFQYIYRVIETEKDRQKFCANLDTFLGFRSGLATTPLKDGQIEIVSVFYYRYKTYLLHGDLKFSRYADSLYHVDHELFNQGYGKMYCQQATLCKYSACDMIVEPDSLTQQEISAKLSKILEALSQTSTKLMDLDKLTIRSINIQSSFLHSLGFSNWFGVKSTNQYFKDFKSEVDSTSTSSWGYNVARVFKDY